MSDMNPDDNMFDSFEEDSSTLPAARKRGSNRTFLLVVGLIGGIMLLLVVAGVLALFLLKPGSQGTLEQAALINAANTATSMAATSNAYTAALALTPSATLPPTSTLPPTPTSVVVSLPTDTLMPTLDSKSLTETPLAVGGLDPGARTATVAALLTQAALGNPTALAGSATVLPNAGFADDYALPLLAGLAAVLVAVIFLVRWLRNRQ